MFQTATILANALARLPPSAPAEEHHDETESYRTVVEPDSGGSDLEAQRRLDAATPGFATAVDLQRTPGARPADGLSEAIARTPGATTRSVGGLGQFSAVSVRGSSPQQVSIFLDGVPLDSAAAGLVDLSEVPLDSLSRIEIYRGHVPVVFGSAAIGGAINLVSAIDDGPARGTVEAGGGSFGTRQSGASYSSPTRRRDGGPGPRWSVRIGYAGSEGDFPYYDTAGTPTFTGDDQTSRRRNNGYDRVLGQVRLDGKRGSTRWGVQELVVYRQRGEPGTASAPATSASADQLVARTTASIRRHAFGSPGGRIGWALGVGISRRSFSDPSSEVGLAADDEHTLSGDLYASPRLRLGLWRGGYLGLTGDLQPQWVAVRERRPPGTIRNGDADRSRVRAGIGAELEQFAWEDRVLVVPAVRVDALANRFAVPPNDGEPSDEGRDDAAFGVSPRVGARVGFVPWLQVRASIGRYFRAPTLLELFGDRGYFVGNEGLRPERGTAADAGLVLDAAGRDIELHAQVAGFWTRAEDLIQWVAAGSVSRPQNVPGARLRGVETSLHVVPRSRAATLTANYTLTDSADLGDDPSRRGQPLPGRPRHEAFARATTGWEWTIRGTAFEPRALYTVEFVGANVLDPSGRFEVPARALQGIGLELHLARRVHFAVEVRNLLDDRTGVVVLPLSQPTSITVPISDFLGYPLPGRSVFAQLRIETLLERPRRRPR